MTPQTSSPTIEQLDDLMVLLPLIMIVIAVCLAFAVRIASQRRTGDGRASAGDPYFFPIGDAPTLPHQVSASALLRNESGGRSTSPRSSVAALTSSEVPRDV